VITCCDRLMHDIQGIWRDRMNGIDCQHLRLLHVQKESFAVVSFTGSCLVS